MDPRHRLNAHPMQSVAGGILLACAMLALAYVAYLTVRPVLVAILLAAAISSLSERLFQWLTARLGGRRRLAAALAVTVLFIGVLAPFTLITGLVVERLISEGTQAAQEVAHGGTLSIERVLPHLGPLGPPLERAFADLRPRLLAAAPAIAGKLGGILASVSKAALEIGVELFLLAVALYYLFLDSTRLRDRMISLLPLPAADTRLFFDRFHRVSVAVFVGNLGTALAQATAATLGYVLFGAPAPLLWGAATLLAALIPLIGPALVWLPVGLVVGVDRGWLRGGGLLLWGIVVVSTIDNLVRPLLTRRGLQLHPLLVFIAVIGGLMEFGFAGLLVGPLVIALVVTVIDVYERHIAEGHDAGS
jgi:predicted PurR-regulated permease PerM